MLLSVNLMAFYPIKIETRIENPVLKFLNADLYTTDTNHPKPVILIQTPYNKKTYRSLEQNNLGNAIFFDFDNYNYVIVDWRGFYSNKGADSAGYYRGYDGYDAVQWIAKQRWSNGKVGTWGGSALGMIQFQTARENPPNLVCAAPYIKDFKTKYSDYYYGGVYRKEYVQSLVKLGFTTEEIIQSHPIKDNLWRGIELNSSIADKVNIPMLLATGWFDHYPGDVIRAFEDLKTKSNSKVRDQHKLIIGPWSHSKMDDLRQGIWEFPEAVDYSTKVAKEFFDYYLLGAKNGYPIRPFVSFFEMGTNQWLYDESWFSIPRNYDTLFLNEGYSLTAQPPMEFISDIANDTIIYDPKDPSPTVGGSRFDPFNPLLPVGPQDIKNDVESRNDVIIYTTRNRKKAMTINGNVKVLLYVSSDRLDTDFAVRLCSVYPDGSSVILTQGIRRMRFRNSYEKEELMTKNSIYLVEIEIEPLCIELPADNELRIIVSSSDYPMFDINLNNGGELYKPGDTLIATNLVYRSAVHASKVLIPYVDRPTSNVQHVVNHQDLYVYPNPAMNELFLHKLLVGKYFRIYDAVGYLQIQGIAKPRIDVSNFNEGVYYLQIEGGSNCDDEMIPFVILR